MERMMCRVNRWLILGLSMLVAACSTKKLPDETELFRNVQEVRKLDLLEMRTEETIIISGSPYTLASVRTLDDALSYVDGLLRTGNRVGVYSFAGYVGAFIDLGVFREEDIRVDRRSKAVEITLPSIQVEPRGRGTTLTKLHERVTGTRRSITTEERTTLQNRASELLHRRVSPGQPLHDELVVRAQDKARAYYTGMLHARGYETVTISFHQEVFRHE